MDNNNQPTEELLIDNKAEEENNLQRIFKLSIKTFLSLVVVGTLLVTCFFNFFPYNAMKFYSDFNLEVRALESAQMYEKRESDKYSLANQPNEKSKYADSLYQCIRLSISLMDKSPSSQKAFYAENVIKYVDKYLYYPRLSFRTDMIDTYNILNSKYPARHPGIYSFENYIICARTEARILAGKKNEEYNELKAINNELYSDNFKVDEIKIREFINYFSRLTKYLDYELYNLGFTSRNEASIEQLEFKNGISFEYFIEKNNTREGITTVYDYLDRKFFLFKEYLEKKQQEIILHPLDYSPWELLEQTYYVKQLSEFSDRICDMWLVIELNLNYFTSPFDTTIKKLSKKWNEKENVTVQEVGTAPPQRKTLTDWYDQDVLNQYLNKFKN